MALELTIIAGSNRFVLLSSMRKPPNRSEPPDGINPDPKTRQTWVQIAKKHNIPIRAFNFTTPSDLCLHNDAVRALGGPLVRRPTTLLVSLLMQMQMNLENRKISARTPFMILQSNFQRPQKSEDYIEVVDVDFEVSFP
jgi:bifunctional polynucleotide phosphatase/kinase